MPLGIRQKERSEQEPKGESVNPTDQVCDPLKRDERGRKVDLGGPSGKLVVVRSSTSEQNIWMVWASAEEERTEATRRRSAAQKNRAASKHRRGFGKNTQR